MDTISVLWNVLFLIIINSCLNVNSHIPENARFRLVGGTNKYNGRVEVYTRGEWGTVCDDYFGTNEAKVLCRTLGFPSHSAVAVSSALYGQGYGNILLDNIECNGTESSIYECFSNTIAYHDCWHGEDVSIMCSDVTHGYRLVNGSSGRVGQVQISTGSEWTSISRENFNKAAATVLCRSLNLPYRTIRITRYNGNSSPVWIENMNCTGNERTLYDCREKAGTVHYTEMGPYVAVACRGEDVKMKLCSDDVDERGTHWATTGGGTLALMSCSAYNPDLNGRISRRCSTTGSWLNPVYNCSRPAFQKIEESVNDILTNVSAPAIDKVLQSLSSETQAANKHSGLHEGEISVTTDILDKIANAIGNKTITEEQSKSFVESAGNLLDTKNHDAWQAFTQSQNRSSQPVKKDNIFTKVLKAVGTYAEAIVRTLDETNQTERVVPSKNIILMVAKLNKPRSIQFPSRSVIPPHTFLETASFSLDKESTEGATGYSCVIYKNLVGILPSTVISSSNVTNRERQELNSAVLAVQLHSNLTHHLPSPIVLHFNHLQEEFKDANCMFWNENRHGWDTSGCQRVNSNLQTTVCECDHMTNFAILMSPWRKASVSTLTIDVLSYVGCSISIVFLIITVVCHSMHWRTLKPHFRTVIIMHLCVALTCSYALFLFGADKTTNKDVCTTMASLLHYMYLAVFFIMLAECTDVAYIVLLPLQQSSRPKWTLAVAWVLPAVIVGISLGVTKLHGYGTESYTIIFIGVMVIHILVIPIYILRFLSRNSFRIVICWLSKEKGLIWAFIAPAILVILCNTIVLILVIGILCRTKSMKQKTVIERVRSSIWCLLVLLPLTGSTWIIGIFYVSDGTEWIQYLFVVCNSLQGFVIFLFHCALNKQMIQAIKKQRNRRRQRSSAVQTSTIQKSSRFHIPFTSKSRTYTVTEPPSTSF